MLSQGIDPARLITSCEAGERPTFGRLIEDGDIFSNPKRILTRQHETELPNAHILGLHAEEHV